MAFATKVNPIRLKLDYDYKHKRAYNIIKNNKSDNRNIKSDILFVILQISFFLLFWFMFKKLRKFYTIIFLPIIVLSLINNFVEFF